MPNPIRSAKRQCREDPRSGRSSLLPGVVLAVLMVGLTGCGVVSPGMKRQEPREWARRHGNTPDLLARAFYVPAEQVPALLERLGDVPSPPQRRVRMGNGMIELGFADAKGRSLPVVECGGVLILPAYPGREYQMRVRNRSDVTIEVVPFVDGLDLESGEPGVLSMAGRRIPPRGETVFASRRMESADAGGSRAEPLRFREVRNLDAVFRTAPTGTLGSVVVAVFLGHGTDSFDDQPPLARRRAVQQAPFPQPHHLPMLLPYQYR